MGDDEWEALCALGDDLNVVATLPVFFQVRTDSLEWGWAQEDHRELERAMASIRAKYADG